MSAADMMDYRRSDQAMDALAAATATRVGIAAAKREIRNAGSDGPAACRAMLVSLDERLLRARVSGVLGAIHRSGPMRVQRLLQFAEIPNPSALVGDLTERQRLRLADAVLLSVPEMDRLRDRPPTRKATPSRVICDVADAVRPYVRDGYASSVAEIAVALVDRHHAEVQLAEAVGAAEGDLTGRRAA